MAQKLESIFQTFRTLRGLFVLGAGASAGLVPFGRHLLFAPVLDYLKNATSFPVQAAEQDNLTARLVSDVSKLSIEQVYPDCIIRPGDTIDGLRREKLMRLPNSHVRLSLKHTIAIPRYFDHPADNYDVFRYFHPSMILNFNHDGLAQDRCGDQHRVVDMHGIIQSRFGSPEIAQWITQFREVDLPLTPDGILLCIPERYDGEWFLPQKWEAAARFRPDFVAVIGFSFGPDDRVSMELFLRNFEGFRGNVYVVAPDPQDLVERLSDGLRSHTVFGVHVYWNIIAHAFLECGRNGPGRRSLDYSYGSLFDAAGPDVSFPRSEE